jgi:tetratricopeptide (TPR) repeat protein
MICRQIPLVVLAFALLLGGCTKHRRETRLLGKADSDLTANRYDNAELELRNALQLVPNEPGAIRRLGLLYYTEGRPVAALPFLKAASAADPKNFDLKLALARIEQSAGAPKDARTTIKSALQSHPPTDEAVMLLFATSSSQADLDDNRAFLEQLRSHDQDRASYHLAAGARLRYQKNNAGALAEWQKAVVLDPKSSEAYVQIADLQIANHQVEAAGQSFQHAADASPLRSGYRLRNITFKLAHGAGPEGKKELARILQEAPDYLPALIYHMKLAQQEKRYDDCSADIKKILARDDRNFDALFEVALLKQTQHDYTGAIAAWERAEAIFPRSAPIKYQLGLSHYAQGELAPAETSLEKAVQLAPGNEEATLVLADLQVRSHEPGDAITSLTELLKKNPRSGPAYLVLARAYEEEKNPEQVLAVLRRAQKIFPDNAQLTYLTGMALNAEHKRPEARAMFAQALKMNPKLGQALEALVNSDLIDHELASARALTEAAVVKDAANPLAFLLRAKVRLTDKNVAGARTDLTRVIELDPGSPVAYLLLAQIDFREHKQQEGVAELKAASDKTRNMTAMMELALVHTQLGDSEAARADYERILKLNPKFAPALANLAYLYTDKPRDLAKASDLAAQARQLRPDDPAIADTLGWIEYRKGNFSGALTFLKEATEKNPSDGEAQYHLGLTYYMLNEEEEASSALQLAAAYPRLSAAAKADAQRRLAVIAIDPATAGAGAVKPLEQALTEDAAEPVARFRLAQIQARQGNAGLAAKNFETQLKTYPRDIRAMVALAQLDAGPLHDLPRARELAKSAHELALNDAHISAALGPILLQAQDYALAADLLQQASRGLPDQPEIAWNLAQAQYATGQVDRAASTLQDALQASAPFPSRAQAASYASVLAAAGAPAPSPEAQAAATRLLATDPGCLPALMVTAASREAAKDHAGAAGIYQKILLADPAFFPAAAQLAQLDFHYLHASDKAADLAAQAHRSLPDDLELNRLLGLIAYDKNDYSAASGAFRAVLLKQPNDAEASFYLGMSQNYLDVGDKGSSALQRAVELGLDPQKSAEAQSTLMKVGHAVP